MPSLLTMNKQTSGNSLHSGEFQKTKNFSRTVASPVRDTNSPSSGLQFPWKVHSMLDNAETEGYDSVVSWDGDNGFKVHDKKAFVEEIVPRYFSQTKYRSFQRMLNMWGYERVCEGPRKGAYTHTHFRRGEPDLCNLMQCQKIKRRHTAPSSLCGSELEAPNFPARQKNKSLVDAFGGRTFHVVEGLQDIKPIHSLEILSLVDDDMLSVFDLATDVAIFP
jgi:hypothetical protein